MPDIWTEGHEKAGAGRFLVGGDAYIAPAECTAYAEIYGEFDASLGSMWASTPTHVSARIRVMIAAAIFGWRPLLAFLEDLQDVALEVERVVGREGGGVVAGLHEKLE